MDTNVQPNLLIQSNSPYLLQHAHNPVQWREWSDETLRLAAKEDKPLLVSIGYAACHWCHVMAHETFEDEAAAAVMNEHFICVKVDREERPDIDQIYMQAVQMMTGAGGWPLNCFALPDGSPFFGGTYFPRDAWIALCENAAREYHTRRDKVEAYARQVGQEIGKPYPFLLKAVSLEGDRKKLTAMVKRWKASFDPQNGGERSAPKFPLPVNLEFLLAYGYLFSDDEAIRHVLLTLQRMAQGGIYDHIGGGFARYSTDAAWKVPHFEKMLYDNAQLISLYARAFQINPDDRFRQVVTNTAAFVEEELQAPEGIFYSSLDADSGGVEGRFYTWELSELKEVLGDLFPIADQYYAIQSGGHWEGGRYILLQTPNPQAAADRLGLGREDFAAKTSEIWGLLRAARLKRPPPALDDKSLTSWNGLMIKALSQAALVFQEPAWLKTAQRAARFILANLKKEDGSLWHIYRRGQAAIPGFLEDYAMLIDALFTLYQTTFNEEWLQESAALTGFCLKNFYDPATDFFFFTTRAHSPVQTRKTEIIDGVIPSSNSVLARMLFLQSRILEKTEWEELALSMLAKMEGQINSQGNMFAHWGLLMLHHLAPFYETAVVGARALEMANSLQRAYLPNVIFSGSPAASSLPILQGRTGGGQTRIFVCQNKACQQPVTSVQAALEKLSPSAFPANS